MKNITLQARSSGGEHYLDAVGVRGSNPLVPTRNFKGLRFPAVTPFCFLGLFCDRLRQKLRPPTGRPRPNCWSGLESPVPSVLLPEFFGLPSKGKILLTISLTIYWIDIIYSIQNIAKMKSMEINQPHIVLWDEVGPPPCFPVESASQITLEVPVDTPFGKDPGQVTVISAPGSLPS